MSRDWLLYLDDLIASAEKIGRLIAGHDATSLQRDEAAFDAVLFNLQVIGKAMKRLPAEHSERLPLEHRRGPSRLRDLIAHHCFAVDPALIFDAAARHVPALLTHALRLRNEIEGSG
jgi:uncharacterized protein with HEPN domain